MNTPTPKTITPIRTKPMPGLPARFAGRELEYLQQALAQNGLSYLKKNLVERAAAAVAQVAGAKYGAATSSGTAALHVAVAAAGIQPGDEVITSPITDMGSLIGILYQNAIPVFADVDPDTYNITPQSVEAALTPRTKAVMLVHLMGGPADLDGLIELCQRKNLILIEDAAQAIGARWRDRHVGSHGHLGCFSFNDSKHLSCGDGGVVVTNDSALYERCHCFADKYYDRHNLGVRLAHLAPNYRLSELQGAVLLAQLDQLPAMIEKRNRLGRRFSDAIADIPGVHPHRVLPHAFCSYWFHMFRIDPQKVGVSRAQFTQTMRDLGVPAGAGYLARLIFHEPLFAERNFFPGGIWPAQMVAGIDYDYRQVQCPVAQQVLDQSVRVPLHQGMDEQDVDDMAAAVRLAAQLSAR